ncbi:unnamed protein product [Blepharisma stoltei]|uniref:Uncharacterized protein n=1 Tax=Blepharisma stoltei TaxID=1481888 RepID=A0AAU9J1E3_9CILI|nr:unnamed protein product [Blepharisma stoltei]
MQRPAHLHRECSLRSESSKQYLSVTLLKISTFDLFYAFDAFFHLDLSQKYFESSKQKSLESLNFGRFKEKFS